MSKTTNLAFHNLCSNTKIPDNTRELLGLGLGFCLSNPKTSTHSVVDFDRFRNDIYKKVYFAGQDDLTPTTLFVPSEWAPDRSEIPPDFAVRVDMFTRHTKTLYQPRISHQNLLPSQLYTLKKLRARDDLIVMKTDKNLGPAIVEREIYIQRALTEHLTDINNYRRLTDDEATKEIDIIRKLLQEFIKKFFPEKNDDSIEYSHKQFLAKSLAQFTTDKTPADPYSYLYLLAKIHKTPWKTRPIVSCSGSILHAIGRWLDLQLQQICQRLPFFLNSSRQLVEKLKAHPPLPPNASLFTCDAVSMYTNINSQHALSEIKIFLNESPLIIDLNLNHRAILEAIDIIMNHNVFRFGDTTWLQLGGTAMGTPPAPMYATLYFAIHEARVLPLFPEIPLYCRYIDDGFGLWCPLPHSTMDDDTTRWNLFQKTMNTYGDLTWEFPERGCTTPFLDLTVSIDPVTCTVNFALYEKALNLYLYLPAHSAHPPGVVKGLTAGMQGRFIELNSCPIQQRTCSKKFLNRMKVRGHNTRELIPILRSTMAKYNPPQTPLHRVPVNTLPEKNRVFLHVNYHPGDPPSRRLQAMFQEHMVHPSNEPPLPSLTNNIGYRIGIDRLTIAYHRPKNLGDLLSPRKLSTRGLQVSEALNR
jgi:hypothetical protein